MRKENLKIVKSLVRKFGKDAAMDKLQEECQELALELHQLNHCPTKTDKKKRLNKVYHELADVKNAIRAVETFLNRQKINRLQNKKLKEKKSKHLQTSYEKPIKKAAKN